MATTRAKTTTKAKKKTVAKKATAKKTIKAAKATKKTATKKAAAKTTAKVVTKTKTPTGKKATTTSAARLTNNEKEIVKHLISIDERLNKLFTLLTNAPIVVPASSMQESTTKPGEPSLFDTAPTTTASEATEPANGSTSWTKENVSQALQEVMAIAGQDEVKEILKGCKAKRVSDIAEADYNAVMQTCADITDAGRGNDQQNAQSDSLSIF